jgi:hypothetical protein
MSELRTTNIYVRDGRTATGYMNYRGDVLAGITADIDSGRPMGPNHMGELMWPVSAVYDAETDRTRVGFSLVPPPQNGGAA